MSEGLGNPTQLSPVRTLLSPDTWVSIKEEIQSGAQTWYRIGQDEYVRSDDVLPVEPSLFRGLDVTPGSEPLIGFVHRLEAPVRTRPGVSPANPVVGLLPHYTPMATSGYVKLGDVLWYRAGAIGARWLFDWASPLQPTPQSIVLSNADNPGTWVFIYQSTAQAVLPELLTRIPPVPRPVSSNRLSDPPPQP